MERIARIVVATDNCKLRSSEVIMKTNNRPRTKSSEGVEHKFASLHQILIQVLLLLLLIIGIIKVLKVELSSLW